MSPGQVPTARLAPGYEIPRIINGCWQLAAGHRLRDRPELGLEDLARLASLGFTAFDGADIYTGVEERLGAFRLAWRDAGGKPEALRVHTKLVPDLEVLPRISLAHVEGIIDRSRRRLGMEILDLVQFHWWDLEVEGWVQTTKWLDHLRKEGKIRHLGLTNFDSLYLRRLLDAGIPVISNQVQYSLLDRRPAGPLTELCRERGVSLLTYGALAGGFLSEHWLGQPDPGMSLANRSLVKYRLIVDEFGGWAAFQELLSLLQRLGDKHGVSISKVAVRWVLERPAVAAVVLGVSSPARAEENLRCFGFELDAADHEALDSLLDVCPGPAGDIYSVERIPGGRHGAIMKTGLNGRLGV